MFGYSSQSLPVVTRRWTSRRIRLAGLAAIVGAVILFAHITYGTVLDVRGIVPGYETIGSVSYYLSEGSLALAWAGMFLGFAALRERLLGLESRLWNVAAPSP